MASSKIVDEANYAFTLNRDVVHKLESDVQKRDRHACFRSADSSG